MRKKGKQRFAYKVAWKGFDLSHTGKTVFMNIPEMQITIVILWQYIKSLSSEKKKSNTWTYREKGGVGI